MSTSGPMPEKARKNVEAVFARLLTEDYGGKWEPVPPEKKKP